VAEIVAESNPPVKSRRRLSAISNDDQRRPSGPVLRSDSIGFTILKLTILILVMPGRP